jgi:ubiquinone/menaquinone biosynthesis C-methylase UbiE
MTDFEKIISYYAKFNEWERLNTFEGKLEYDLCIPIILKNLPKNAEILDLGGGPGRYTLELAKRGYLVHLADLSNELLEQARTKINELGVKNVKSITQVNAVDLNCYEDRYFDVVLLLGPLYHLTNEDERNRCVKEVNRVLKNNGIVMASFIPYLSGAIGVAGRMFNFPDQVDIETLKRVFLNGIFNNKANRGFQEGYYPPSKEIIQLFSDNGFSKISLRSIRGWGNGREAEIYKIQEKDIVLFNAIIDIINRTSDDPAIIETCSHAFYIGRKEIKKHENIS